jgi:hypothetical protein
MIKTAEPYGIEGLVDRTPPDMLGAPAFAYNKTVVRGTTGVMAGPDHQGTEMRKVSLGATHRLFIQGGSGKIPVFAAEVLNAMIF